MKTLEIYDPPMCCPTGVCGTDVDPKLVQFASDLSWLKEQGVNVQRFNLAQQPAAFAANSQVTDALKAHGNGCLPLVLVDGEIVTRSIYPTREQLASLVGLEEESCCCGDDDHCCEDDEKDEPCCGGNTGCCG